MLIDELNGARLTNPFEVLGLQPNHDGQGWILRAWLPGAKEVSCVALSGGK